MAGCRTGYGVVKTFIIGDIHGCYEELQDLLNAAALASDDQIIAIGDLVNRGPDSARVWDFFTHNVSSHIFSLMGNHEHKHLRAAYGKYQPSLSMLLTRWQFNQGYHEALCAMRDMPLSVDLPEALIVHAYYEPGLPLAEQQDRVLLGTLGASKYLRRTYKQPWYRLYDGEKPLVVGHKDMSGCHEPFVYQDRVFGLDTGCVYGGKLTGLLLPDFKLISVPARDTHWQNILSRYQNPD